MLNSTCQIIELTLTIAAECELWWFDIFDSFSIVQPIRLFELLKQQFWLPHCTVLHESIEHANDTVVRFGIKIYFENWK